MTSTVEPEATRSRSGGHRCSATAKRTTRSLHHVTCRLLLRRVQGRSPRALVPTYGCRQCDDDLYRCTERSDRGTHSKVATESSATGEQRALAGRRCRRQLASTESSLLAPKQRGNYTMCCFFYYDCFLSWLMGKSFLHSLHDLLSCGAVLSVRQRPEPAKRVGSGCVSDRSCFFQLCCGCCHHEVPRQQQRPANTSTGESSESRPPKHRGVIGDIGVTCHRAQA